MDTIAGLSGGVRTIGNRPADTFPVLLTRDATYDIARPAQHDQNSTILSSISDPPTRWNGITRIALFALIVLWTVKVWSTWATWGNLTVDSGREMYVPALLAEGKKGREPRVIGCRIFDTRVIEGHRLR